MSGSDNGGKRLQLNDARRSANVQQQQEPQRQQHQQQQQQQQKRVSSNQAGPRQHSSSHVSKPSPRTDRRRSDGGNVIKW